MWPNNKHRLIKLYSETGRWHPLQLFVIILSDLCHVCLVFPPLVSIYGLFPVLVSCHYEFIRFQVCVCV